VDLVYDKTVEFNIHKAKTQFSKLIQRVESGEEVIIARAGVPVARLVPIQPANGVRPLGMDRGKVWIADDFNTLPDDLLKEFYGGELPTPEPRARESK
jgi:prevent-host-death family protein